MVLVCLSVLGKEVVRSTMTLSRTQVSYNNVTRRRVGWTRDEVDSRASLLRREQVGKGHHADVREQPWA